MEFGEGFPEQAWEGHLQVNRAWTGKGRGNRWGLGGGKCWDSMFGHSPPRSTPGGISCLGQGPRVAVAFSLCTTPRWHLLITLMSGPKLDLPPHTAQQLKRKVS